MSYRNERFNKAMRSLESMTAEIKDVSKARVFSDGGESEARMVAALDYEATKETSRERQDQQERAERLFSAEMRLVEAGKKHLIRVLLLIVENGGDREKSLEQVPRATYFRHRDELLKFFATSPKPSTSNSQP